MPPTSAARREIAGVIEGGKPLISLELTEPAVRLSGVLVDTGFNGSLAVPIGTLEQWNRDNIDVAWVTVADGTGAFRKSAEVEVDWLGERRAIKAIELGHQLVIGMGLLIGTTITLADEVVAISLASPETGRASGRSGH